MEDKVKICRDCQQEFVFTVGEQEFYQKKGYENEPARCPECRRQHKAKFNNDRPRYDR